MKRTKNGSTKETEFSIPADIQALLDATPDTPGFAEVIREDLARLDRDPKSVAEYLKMQFVEDVYEAMDERGWSPSKLARELGWSRQYVGKVLNEKANFTFKTIAKIACKLDLRIAVRMYAHEEHMAILPTVARPRLLMLRGFQPEKRPITSGLGDADAGHIAA